MGREKKNLERFVKLSGGLCGGDFECVENKERLRFCIKSRWFDTTGEKDDVFTDKVADEYWRLIEGLEEDRFAHADITAVKKNIERLQSKFAGE